MSQEDLVIQHRARRTILESSQVEECSLRDPS